VLAALVKKVDLLIAQTREETVGVKELANFAIGKNHPQSIPENLRPPFQDAFKKSLFGNLSECCACFRNSLERDHLARLGIANKRPHNNARPALALDHMNPQGLVWMTVGRREK